MFKFTTGIITFGFWDLSVSNANKFYLVNIFDIREHSQMISDNKTRGLARGRKYLPF